jgi:hypothetical protein
LQWASLIGPSPTKFNVFSPAPNKKIYYQDSNVEMLPFRAKDTRQKLIVVLGNILLHVHCVNRIFILNFVCHQFWPNFLQELGYLL